MKSAPAIGEKRSAGFIGAVKGVDADAKTIDAIVSTINPDRDDEIILPSAFTKRLHVYKRNPIFIWGHDPTKPENYLGTASRVDVLPRKGLAALFDCSKVLAIPEAERARLTFGLYRTGTLASFSVGFMPYAWLPVNGKLPQEVLDELDGIDLTNVRLIYTDVELWEISGCGIPSNRESMVVGRAVKEILGKSVQIVGEPEWAEAGLCHLVDGRTAIVAFFNGPKERTMTLTDPAAGGFLGTEDGLPKPKEDETVKCECKCEKCDGEKCEGCKCEGCTKCDSSKVTARRVTEKRAEHPHPRVHDVISRLRGAADSLSVYVPYFSDDDVNGQPMLSPDNEKCKAVSAVIGSIKKDLDDMSAGPVQPDTPASTSNVQTAAIDGPPASKSGAMMSAENQKVMKSIHKCMKDAMFHHEGLMKKSGMDDSDMVMDDDYDPDTPDPGEAGTPEPAQVSAPEKAISLTLTL